MKLENCRRDLVAFVTSKDLYSHGRFVRVRKKSLASNFSTPSLHGQYNLPSQRERKRKKERIDQKQTFLF